MAIRLRLEYFFKVCFTLGVSVLIQILMIYSVLSGGMSLFFILISLVNMLQLLVTTFLAYRLLEIKNKEKTREWRQGASFIIGEIKRENDPK